MKKYYICMVNNRDQYDHGHYVVTKNDVDEGGFLDPEPENFGIDTRTEAENIKAELEAYAEEKFGYGEHYSFHIEEFESISLYDIADFWNEKTKDGREPDMDALNAMIEEGGYMNDCHEQWGICHSNKGKVVLQDDMTAYVENDYSKK